MPIRRWVAIALASAAWASTCAAAGPLMRYSWDDCQPVVPSKYFTIPGTYTQTVSAMGLEGPVQDLTLVIGFQFQSIPSAWQFADLCQPFNCPFFPPCQSPGRISMLLGGSACDTLPGLALSASYWFKLTPPISGITITGSGAGAFTPDPMRRYTLVRFAFDHSHSVAGAGGSGTCGGADQPLSFLIGDLFLNGVDQRARATWENCVVTWNSPAFQGDCPLVVPVRNRTWGQIKSFYR